MNIHVEQRQPILDGLQRKAYQDQTNSENTQALLGHMIGAPLPTTEKHSVK